MHSGDDEDNEFTGLLISDNDSGFGSGLSNDVFMGSNAAISSPLEASDEGYGKLPIDEFLSDCDLNDHIDLPSWWVFFLFLLKIPTQNRETF